MVDRSYDSGRLRFGRARHVACSCGRRVDRQSTRDRFAAPPASLLVTLTGSCPERLGGRGRCGEGTGCWRRRGAVRARRRLGGVKPQLGRSLRASTPSWRRRRRVEIRGRADGLSFEAVAEAMGGRRSSRGSARRRAVSPSSTNRLAGCHAIPPARQARNSTARSGAESVWSRRWKTPRARNRRLRRVRPSGRSPPRSPGAGAGADRGERIGIFWLDSGVGRRAAVEPSTVVGELALDLAWTRPFLYARLSGLFGVGSTAGHRDRRLRRCGSYRHLARAGLVASHRLCRTRPSRLARAGVGGRTGGERARVDLRALQCCCGRASRSGSDGAPRSSTAASGVVRRQSDRPGRRHVPSAALAEVGNRATHCRPTGRHSAARVRLGQGGRQRFLSPAAVARGRTRPSTAAASAPARWCSSANVAAEVALLGQEVLQATPAGDEGAVDVVVQQQPALPHPAVRVHLPRRSSSRASAQAGMTTGGPS